MLQQLNEEELAVLQTLQDKLRTPPLLALPMKERIYTLDKDACDGRSGCVLMPKRNDNAGRPILYWFKILNSRERNLDTSQQEYLAVVWKRFLQCPHLDSTKFSVSTDHQELKCILNFADANGTPAR